MSGRQEKSEKTARFGRVLTLALLGTLWTYWQWALGPGRLGLVIHAPPRWVGLAGTLLLTLPLAGFVAWKVGKRQWQFLLPLVWFVVVLLPVLPLRDHVEAYYLTLPTAGLAWLGGWALALAFRARWFMKGLAVALAAVYVVAGVAAGILPGDYVCAQATDNQNNTSMFSANTSWPLRCV